MEATIPHISTPKKANLSLKIDFDKKNDLQEIASRKNRSVHYLLVEAVQNYIAEQKEKAEYEKYVEERVMKAYNRLEKEGSNGVDSEQVLDVVMSRVQARLAK